MATGRQSPELRRSLICVPTSNEKMLENSRTLRADQILFDWEDSVAPSQKEAARAALARALGAADGFQAQILSVRINAISTPWYKGDIAALAAIAPNITSIVLPKCASVREIEQVTADLAKIEQRSKSEIGIDAQIEGALGLVKCAQIAAQRRVLSLSFGPLDFLADIGVATTGELTSAERLIEFALCNVIVGARSAGKLAFDGPVAEFRDLKKFEASALRSRALGFDGKWVIHPDQIQSCNRIYTPSEQEAASAENLLAKYGVALAESGAIDLGGTMVDEASYRIAQRTLRRRSAFR